MSNGETGQMSICCSSELEETEEERNGYLVTIRICSDCGQEYVIGEKDG